jgi:hypothetical protein
MKMKNSKSPNSILRVKRNINNKSINNITTGRKDPKNTKKTKKWTNKNMNRKMKITNNKRASSKSTSMNIKNT